MFKFVVLCACVAVAAATASPDIIAPFAYSSNILAPATRFVSSYPNNLIYSSPYYSSPSLAYSSPLGYSHFIKKRSAPLAVSSYIAPSAYIAPSTYVASAPLATTYSTASPFISTYAGAPLAATYSAAAPFATTYTHPILSTTAHFIKKRSALLPIAAYASPVSYSHISRFDYRATSPAVTYTSYAGAAPLPYSPFAVSHLY